MRGFTSIFVVLLGLFVLPATSSLTNIVLLRETMTEAHLRTINSQHDSHHHSEKASDSGHSHKHRHSPTESEHEHQQIDPSLLAMLGAVHDGGPLGFSDFTFHIKHSLRAESHDQTLTSLTFTFPLRPPIT